jgi:hypothetical protein
MHPTKEQPLKVNQSTHLYCILTANLLSCLIGSTAGIRLSIELHLAAIEAGDSNSVATADLDLNGIIYHGNYQILAAHWLDNDCHTPDWCLGADID